MQDVEPTRRVGKLVRDKIPEIIRRDGAEPVIYIAGPEEYRERLLEKLGEEYREVLEADDEAAPGELADLVEAALAYATLLGVSAEQLEEIRAAKQAERGGFADRIVWMGNR
ncbi:hypothetical protein ACFWR9_08120 [Streptomyces sp. NPDC058534]|uniref:hypothetical protein n=1 Tax=Streptomyces sp. NPDC058534 TaxID=3346541 RepID=UPI0036627657